MAQSSLNSRCSFMSLPFSSEYLTALCSCVPDVGFLSVAWDPDQRLPLTGSSADRRGLDVRRGVHGGRRVPAGHSNDRQLPAVSPPQTLALRPALHEPLQRGQCQSRREPSLCYITSMTWEAPVAFLSLTCHAFLMVSACFEQASVSAGSFM